VKDKDISRFSQMLNSGQIWKLSFLHLYKEHPLGQPKTREKEEEKP